MTNPTVETQTDSIPDGVCPKGGCEITYPADAQQIICPHDGCDKVFNNEPPVPKEGPTAPQEPQEPSTPLVEPSSEPSAASEPREPPQPPPGEPVEPPPSVSEEQEAVKAEPQASTEPTEPAAPPVEVAPEEADPPGAGDAVTPAEVRKAKAAGAGRKKLEPVEKPGGCPNFTYASREFNWTARGGRGNPYGPNSVSAYIFEIVMASGNNGIDPVDVCVKLRKKLVATKREVGSILARVSAVVERSCLSEYVQIMERLPGSKKVRVTEQHRGAIVAPDGMVGVKRAAELAQQG